MDGKVARTFKRETRNFLLCELCDSVVSKNLIFGKGSLNLGMMRKMLLLAGLLLFSATAQDKLLYLGGEFIRLQNWPVAISYFEQALKEDPQLDKAWYGKGVALCQLGKYDDGLSCLDRALQIDPKSVEYLYTTGVCHEWKGKSNWKQAEAYYRKALELAPGQAQFHHKLGSLLQQEGRFQEAIPEYQKAISLDPGQFIS